MAKKETCIECGKKTNNYMYCDECESPICDECIELGEGGINLCSICREEHNK